MPIRQIAFFIGAAAAVLAVVALTYERKSNESPDEALPTQAYPHGLVPQCPTPCGVESLFSHAR